MFNSSALSASSLVLEIELTDQSTVPASHFHSHTVEVNSSILVEMFSSSRKSYILVNNFKASSSFKFPSIFMDGCHRSC